MKTEKKTGGEERYAAWVGFDWADQEHIWVLQWADTGERESGRLEQTPEAVENWLSQLMTRLNGRRIAIAIEQKHGAVADSASESIFISYARKHAWELTHRLHQDRSAITLQHQSSSDM